MKSTDLKDELYDKIDQYFIDNNLSKYADTQMGIKLSIAVTWWVLSLILLFTVDANRMGFFALYSFHCFAQLYILLNIAHDANHMSIAKNRKLGNPLRYSFDLCGVSSYMWRELHHAQHHHCINIEGEDETLIARHLFRFTSKTRHRFIHRFQHLYFFIFYGLFTVDWVLLKDFECFFFPHTDYLEKKKHPKKEYIKLFAWKLFYLGYMILLPIFMLGYSVVYVLLLFFVCHFMIGIIGGTVIQITHPLTGAEFPESKEDYDHFVYHVFATTADYSVDGRFADWFFGGLHLHVIHHLCPKICHTHYRDLTKIVKRVAEKHQVGYRVNRTMYDAIKDHYLHLKSLST